MLEPKHAGALWALPAELIVNILEALDFRAVLACTLVCRELHTLVIETTSLCYKIELALAGQQDGPPSVVSAASRLETLKQHQVAWRELQWTAETSIPMSEGGLWELYGGVLAQVERTTQTFTFLQLPSTLRGIEEKQWTVASPGFPVRDFCLDSAQDLLVFIETPHWIIGDDTDQRYKIHLHSLLSGTPHPHAPSPAILYHTQKIRDLLASYSIQISGDYIAVLFISRDHGENELLVWRWKDGFLEMALSGDDIRSFAFLSERHIIVTTMSMYDNDPPEIRIVDFRAAVSEKMSIGDADYTCSLLYPTFRAHVIPMEIAIRSDPAPDWTPGSNLHVPFSVSGDSRLYVVTFWARHGQTASCFALHVPAKTFSSQLHGLGPGSRRIFSWGEWGPQGTRMLKLANPTQSQTWVCYVYGSKYVVPELTEDGDERTVNIVVYDYNQLAIKRASQVGDSNAGLVMEPNVVEEKRNRVFEGSVTTSLPYHIKKVSAERWKSTMSALMCSEDSIILVGVDRRYRILTF